MLDRAVGKRVTSDILEYSRKTFHVQLRRIEHYRKIFHVQVLSVANRPLIQWQL
jgi:hypothetical protein